MGLFERPEESVSLLFWNPTNVSTLFIYRDFLYVTSVWLIKPLLVSANLIEWSYLLA